MPDATAIEYRPASLTTSDPAPADTETLLMELGASYPMVTYPAPLVLDDADELVERGRSEAAGEEHLDAMILEALVAP
jgi:hypothetical protein